MSDESRAALLFALEEAARRGGRLARAGRVGGLLLG